MAKALPPVEAELTKALSIRKRPDEAQADYMARLVKGVSGLGDPEWDALSEPVQFWANAAIKAVKANTEIPAFPAKPDASVQDAAPATEAASVEVEVMNDPLPASGGVEQINSQDGSAPKPEPPAAGGADENKDTSMSQVTAAAGKNRKKGTGKKVAAKKKAAVKAKAKKPAAKKAAAKKAVPKSKPAAKPKAVKKGDHGSQKALVHGLLTRKSGCTGKDVLEATGWKAVNVLAMAKHCGLKLRIEKVAGKPKRYFGTPLK